MAGEKMIDEKALDRLSVAPGDAANDWDTRQKVEDDPEDKDAQLDAALDESMDASDPPAATQPGSGEPAPSSGYDEETERQHDA